MALCEEECRMGMPVKHVKGFYGILTGEFNYDYQFVMAYIIRSDTGKSWGAYLHNLSRYSR